MAESFVSSAVISRVQRREALVQRPPSYYYKKGSHSFGKEGPTSKPISASAIAVIPQDRTDGIGKTCSYKGSQHRLFPINRKGISPKSGYDYERRVGKEHLLLHRLGEQ